VPPQDLGFLSQWSSTRVEIVDGNGNEEKGGEKGGEDTIADGRGAFGTYAQGETSSFWPTPYCFEEGKKEKGRRGVNQSILIWTISMVEGGGRREKGGGGEKERDISC